MQTQMLALMIPSGPDLIVIAVLVLVLFGAKKLPAIARSIPRIGAEFVRGKREMVKEIASLKAETDEVVSEIKDQVKEITTLPKIG